MIYFIIAIVLFGLQLFYFRLADRFNIIDKPNERSSHTRITLRGGGIIFYPAVLIFFVTSGFLYPWFWVGLSLISIISFADDIKPQSSKLRLSIHFVAILLLFMQWGLFNFPWYYWIFALVLCTGIVNAYNFMDGINGITGAYSMAGIICLWYINNYVSTFTDNRLIYLTIIALLVFCFFNFRKKARCFAGDVGSVSMAFIVVFLLGQLIISSGNFSYIMLLSVYGVDAVLTIAHRITLRENIFKPHRKHLYQLLANELKVPHLIVSGAYAVLQLIISMGLLLSGTHHVIYSLLVITGLCTTYVCIKKKYFFLHTANRQ
ncbi:MAG: putative UndPP-QuiNAc-P-transferase [Bacteroidetes bacterium]|nr:putative UndPP-QuiNAc-P-transferase [Bacteroidota bacterium]